jgi:hypothetical protein
MMGSLIVGVFGLGLFLGDGCRSVERDPGGGRAGAIGLGFMVCALIVAAAKYL